MDDKRGSKKQLRAKNRDLLSQVANDYISSASEKVCLTLSNWLESIMSGSKFDKLDLLIWLPLFPGEMDLTPNIKEAMAKGASIYNSEIVGEEMKFYRLTGDNLELDKSKEYKFDKKKKTVVYVPCLGYTSDGHRLGRGKACYDKFFSSIPSDKVIKILTSMKMQELDNIATEGHDVKVDLICTEDGICEIKIMKILCLGDIVGKSGRNFIKAKISSLRNTRKIDLIIANAENASGGLNLGIEQAKELKNDGIDIMTLGDHFIDPQGYKDKAIIACGEFCVMPSNLTPAGLLPGFLIKEVHGIKVGVFSLIGQVFLENSMEQYKIENPYLTADKIVNENLKECNIIICDLHAEATSEKIAMGYYLDGRVSFIFGTHTHVQTADEKILEGGTGYITDLGMCGPAEGVIGMDKDAALRRLIYDDRSGRRLAKGKSMLNGVIVDINNDGKCTSIERVSIIE